MEEQQVMNNLIARKSPLKRVKKRVAAPVKVVKKPPREPKKKAKTAAFCLKCRTFQTDIHSHDYLYHFNMSRYSCIEKNCNARFSRMSNGVSHHQKMHKFKCNLCDDSFQFLDGLKRHVVEDHNLLFSFESHCHVPTKEESKLNVVDLDLVNNLFGYPRKHLQEEEFVIVPK